MKELGKEWWKGEDVGKGAEGIGERNGEKGKKIVTAPDQIVETKKPAI